MQEADVKAPLTRYVISDGPLQGRVSCLQRIEHGAIVTGPSTQLSPRPIRVPAFADVRGEDSDCHAYAIVCTSTDRTGGRSLTIGDQVLPASGDAYTCPPVVPKYTPQESRVSTAIASRRTFT